MILSLHLFHKEKPVEIEVEPGVVMDFLDNYQKDRDQIFAFMGKTGQNVYVPAMNINYFEVTDVPEELPESTRTPRRTDPGPGVQPEA